MTDQERTVEEQGGPQGEPRSTAEAAETSAAEAAEAAEAVEAPAAEAVEAPAAEAVEAPAAEAVEAPAAEAVEAPAAEVGASYTPPAEETGGRPRRVKDLEPGMDLEGKVTSIALYGIFVDIGVGRDGLVHISEMSDTRIDTPSDLVQINDVVKVRVKSVEPDGRRISLTMRTRERGESRGRGRRKPDVDRERLATLKIGDLVDGTVTGLAPFGVFVDIGVGKDGLVHISELAEGRIEKAEDAVQIGQSYTFKILEVDSEGSRISLSLRRAQRGQRLQQLERGQICEGTVSGLAPFGAFVDIGVGRDGLVHISELTEGRVARVEDAVKVGDKVKVRVLEVDLQSKRISLTLRLEDRPREESAPETPYDPSARMAPREDRPREDRPRGEDRPRDARPPRPPREDRPARRGPRPGEPGGDANAQPYLSTEEVDEPFVGDATLDDLLSRFGGGKRDRRHRPEEEETGDRYTRRQRDAIRRTLQQLNEDE